MRINRGRGWEDQGATNAEFLLPDDVVMPVRHLTMSEFSGDIRKTFETRACHVDLEEAVVGTGSETHMDTSRHSGIAHGWNAHPHAKVEVEFRNDPWPTNGGWVEDGRGGFRRIDIGAVTHYHDCGNHIYLGEDE